MLKGLYEDFLFKDFHSIKDLVKPKYRHVFWSLFFAVHTYIFFVAERRALTDFHEIHCKLDDIIPFNEYFILFYALWYPFWILFLLYACLFEVDVFKMTMKYFIVAFTLSNVIYFAYPSGHTMWPDPMPRHNFCTWLTERIYAADNPTCIFPSDHVVGAFAVVFGAWRSKRFSNKIAFPIILFIALGITISICFVKQHSCLDILGAMPVIAIGYFAGFFRKPGYRKKMKNIKNIENT